jgi:DNA (cytosine-5)-methyltransferase 1
MKILNLYAGIGGNRQLWGEDHEITAIEYKEDIANAYKAHFPNDTVIVGDAHQYLLEHYHEFDFIWSSPPCQTHTSMNVANHLSPYPEDRERTEKQRANGGGIPSRYPKMELYQEIIFLTHFFKGKWAVENVVGYYEPLIPPVKMEGHYWWTNFHIRDFNTGMARGISGSSVEELNARRGFDMEKLKGLDKRLVLRNCVEPEIGKHILDCAINESQLTLL